jgi:RNA polymerase sigma-70 factor (ECF subfamily)
MYRACVAVDDAVNRVLTEGRRIFGALAEQPDFDEWLCDAWQGATRTWPNLGVSPEVFAAHLRASTRADAPLKDLQTSDLFLACGCLAGDPTALATFDREFLSRVASYVARIDSSAIFADEVRQALRQHLLVAEPGHQPRLARYDGSAPLGAWLRVVSVRLALNLRRARGQVLPRAEDGAPVHPPTPDPELDYLKARYGQEVHTAFAAVLRAITPKERNLLRLHFLEGMTVHAIATVYQVNKSTISRWLAECRARLLDETRRVLSEKLKLDPAEFDSMIALVQSRLDVSLRGFLGGSTK